MPHFDLRADSKAPARAAPRRPAILYFHTDRASAGRALSEGEFRLTPTSQGEPVMRSPESMQILPFGLRKSIAGAGFLTLGLSTGFQQESRPPGVTDCCIAIRNTEEFGERLHRAVQRALPQWAGIDAAVAYGAPSPLGAAFTKSLHLSWQQEWLFAWRPMQPTFSLRSMVVQIGSIEAIAKLRAANNVSKNDGDIANETV